MTLEEYGEMYVKSSGSNCHGGLEVPTIMLPEDNENRYCTIF